MPPGLAIREIGPRLYAIAGVPSSAGTFGFTLAITDACGRSGQANLAITVSAAAGTTAISASPSGAQFTVQQFDTASPPDQSIALSSATPVSYFVSLAPGTSGNWLSASGSVSGAAPATIKLHVANYSTLAAGTYTAGVVVNLSAGGPPLIVPVTLTITPSAAITVSPASVTLTVAATGSDKTASQTVSVDAPQAVAYSVSATTQSGGGWLSISKTSGTTTDTFDIDANAGSLPPGTYSGTVTVTPVSAPGPTQSIAVSLVVTTSAEVMPTPGAITVVYRAGDPAPAAQSISLDTLGGDAATFSIAPDAPWVTASPNAGSAPGSVSVTVDPTGLSAGAHYASVVISTPAAANGQMSIPVTLFVPTPNPAVKSVQNAASFASGPVAPGEAVVIYGSHLGPPFLVSGTAANGVQSTTAGGVQVLFNGTPAPILYAREDVVSAIVPFGVASGSSATLQVSVVGLLSNAVTLSTAAAAPGIFTSGSGQAIAVNADGSLNGPGHGAPPGSVIGVYVTGGGATSPASKDGQLSNGASQALAQQVTAQVNGIDSTVVSAGNAPGFPAGVSLVQVQLPASLPASTAVSITVAVGGASTQAGVTVYIGP